MTAVPPLTTDLSGVRAKIDRAKDQVVKLDAEIGVFIDGRPYEVITERNTNKGQDVYRVRVRQDPPLRFGVIVGEVIHDLRSALDHVAWQLVPNAKRTRSTGFPVFATDWWPGQKSEAAFLRQTDGMSREARAVIERLQPNQPGKPLDKDDVLYRMHEMNLTDKHRVLNVLGGATEQKHVTVGLGGGKGTVSIPWEPAWGPPIFEGVIGGQAWGLDYDRPGHIVVSIPGASRGVSFAGIDPRPKPFTEGAVLTRVVREPETDVKVNATFSFTVVMDESWPGNSEPVVPALQQFLRATEMVIDLLGPLV